MAESDLATRLTLIQFLGLVGTAEAVVPMLEAGREYDIVLEYVPAKGHPVARLEWVPRSGDDVDIRAREIEDIVAGRVGVAAA